MPKKNFSALICNAKSYKYEIIPVSSGKVTFLKQSSEIFINE